MLARNCFRQRCHSASSTSFQLHATTLPFAPLIHSYTSMVMVIKKSLKKYKFPNHFSTQQSNRSSSPTSLTSRLSFSSSSSTLLSFTENCSKNINNKKRWFSSLGKGQDLIESDEFRTQIRGFGDTSFMINDVLVRQSVLCLPHSFLLWENVRSFEDITIESLSLFTIFYPTIEVLFIGCGENMPRQLNPEISKYFRSKGIILEISNTVNAASTFNVLNSEGRNVAAALITNLPVPLQDPLFKRKATFGFLNSPPKEVVVPPKEVL